MTKIAIYKNFGKQLYILTYFELKTLGIVLFLGLNMLFGAQRNRIIETLLLSTHNMCFGWGMGKVGIIMHFNLEV